MDDPDCVKFLQMVSSDADELTNEREYEFLSLIKYTYLETIEILLKEDAMKPSQFSSVAIEKLADLFAKNNLEKPEVCF